MPTLRQVSKRALAAALIFTALPTLAQPSLMIYPAKGQSPDQQSKDKYECNQWAIQQSGFDPANPQAAATGKSGTGMGKEVLRGGARGAAAGAAIGAIAGDAGKGAAIGATAGGLGRGMRKREEARNAPPPEAPGQANYQKAMAACLEGRGYSVK
jgi:hypothetical protein